MLAMVPRCAASVLGNRGGVIVSIRVRKRRWLSGAAIVLICLASGLLAVRESGMAEAAWADIDIASAGPLTHIFIGNNLSCQVAHTGDAVYEMYSPSSEQADCGTFLLYNGISYGNFLGDQDFTPVSQSAVTGSGTTGDPYKVVTVVDAGTSGIEITETDSYVLGDEFYRTDVQIHNANDVAADVRIYRGADCYLGGSDVGYGYADPSTKTVACTQNANNSPAGRVEMWTPITPASHYQEGYYGTVIGNVENHTELTDTCDCTTAEDNGAMIDWNLTVSAGGTSTVSSYSAFSPTGSGLPIGTPSAGGPAIVRSATPTKTATPKATVTPPPATDTAVPVVTVAPAVPTATRAGGGTLGSITGPNTGSGPGGSTFPIITLLSALLFVAGIGASVAAYRVRE